MKNLLSFVRPVLAATAVAAVAAGLSLSGHATGVTLGEGVLHFADFWHSGFVLGVTLG